MKGDDVKEKLKETGLTLKEVSDRMGISPQALHNILKTEDIKVGVLKSIADAINETVYFFFEDILTESPMPKYEVSNTTFAPLISQYAYGGYMSGFADDSFMEAQPLYIASKKYSGGNYVAFEVRGDSMDDGTWRSIRSADVVLGREQDWAWLKTKNSNDWYSELCIFEILHKPLLLVQTA